MRLQSWSSLSQLWSKRWTWALVCLHLFVLCVNFFYRFLFSWIGYVFVFMNWICFFVSLRVSLENSCGIRFRMQFVFRVYFVVRNRDFWCGIDYFFTLRNLDLCFCSFTRYSLAFCCNKEQWFVFWFVFMLFTDYWIFHLRLLCHWSCLCVFWVFLWYFLDRFESNFGSINDYCLSVFFPRLYVWYDEELIYIFDAARLSLVIENRLENRTVL